MQKKNSFNVKCHGPCVEEKTEGKKMSTFRLLHEERDRVSPKDRLSAEVVATISDY